MSCAFYLPECTHGTLFQPTYVRCQKSQGQKILRCFPHCCPQHIHYRNCGTAICLAVQPRSQLASLRAVLAFTAATDDVFAPHDVVPTSYFEAHTRSRSNVFGTLYEGLRLPSLENTSGRSKAQRDLPHVLRAYVFEAAISNDDEWVLIASVASTPFTIVSYRGEHNKKKREQLQIEDFAPQSTSSDHLMTILSSLQAVSLEATPSPLLEWLRVHVPLPLPVASGGPASDVSTAYHNVCLAMIVALSHKDVFERMNDVLVANAASVLDKTDLQRVYYECLMEQVLFPILEAVLSQHHVSAVEVASAMSPSTDHHFFVRFVAQMRESYILTQTLAPTRFRSPSAGSAVDGSWVWQQEATVVHHWALSTSLMHYLRFLDNMSSFQQRFSGHTLHMRSNSPRFSTVPSEFVCDASPRSLRVLPTGESCLADLIVDYVGFMGPHGDVTLALYLLERNANMCLLAEVHIAPRDGQTLLYTVRVHRANAPSPVDDAFFDADASTRVTVCQTEWLLAPILRCFPHCCPGHVHYRNCGASLYVRATPHTHPLHVFGLFSLSDEDPYPVGTIVDANLVQRELRVPSNVRGSLVSAVRDEIIPNAFRFDEKELNGWQYSWKSGRSKAQRDLAHVFRAIVLTPIAPDVWCVVGVATSTPFTIVSYRGEYNKRKRAGGTPSELGSSSSSRSSYDILLSYIRAFRVDMAPSASVAWLHHAIGVACPTLGSPRPSSDSAWHDQICVAIALALCGREFVAEFNACLLTHAAAVLAKPESQAIFNRFFEHVLLPTIDRVVSTFGTTVGAVADAITHHTPPPALFSVQDFRPRFVAQLREAYIAATQGHPSWPSFTFGNSVFNGAWQRQSTTVHTPWRTGVTLPHYLRWLSNTTAFHIRLDAPTLLVRAVTPRFTAVPSSFLLDGSLGSLRVLPDGESCLGTIAVDYRGHVAMSGDIHLTLYGYERGGAAYLLATVRLHVTSEDALVVSATVDVGRAIDAPDAMVQAMFDLKTASRVEVLDVWPRAPAAAFDLQLTRVPS
ncbi:hypothetical protein SDRG_14838 [Saprolegnia diclina VS20]|uniref:Uncharacterized protein n=1 Tax=Saprolegnia diclina (strain VS20) TaxID=1156394 RepID=T0R5R3_SAPDV|nr:hypothetical protein SDRG_14838 [Saprolegnia diclina VS20]EQC27398.1 hypothetical protein SDRG_14838 [Saprolegnia diclina VS20]|eukprot:XP_008619217.1 hypothetical protein SDRG_14838 [Saprolegnia diclina VS20]